MTETRFWLVGNNLAGYMPMNAPWLTTSWSSAKESLAYDIDQYADSLWDSLSMSVDKLLGDHELTDQTTAADILRLNGENLTEHDRDVLEELVECDDALKRLDEVEPGTEVGIYINNQFYFLSETDRNHMNIPEDIDDDELEAFIERLNEMSY